MGNPNISGLPINWYQNASWPAMDITASQNAYNSALVTLNAASADYLAKKDTLNTVMASGTKAQITNAQALFNISSSTLAAALSNMQAAYVNLTTVAQEAKNDIDDKVDQKLNDFAQNLMNVMNQQLTLPATVSNTLDLQFNNANDVRIAARTTFTAALSTFYSTQSSLNVLLNTFQHDNDILLSLQAQYAKDSAPPAASAATLAADLAAINAQQAVVNADSTNIQTATSTRDARLSSLQSALLAYQTALDAEVGVLNQAGQIASVTVTDFLADIQSIIDNAQLAAQNAIAAAANADTLLRNQLLAQFPSLDPSINQTTAAAQDQYLTRLAGITGSTLNADVNLTSNVNAPLMPAPGKMSMSQLMQFITLVEVLLDQLIREIRRTDSRVNELRLSLFEAAGRGDADKISAQQEFANKLMQADLAYNNKVARNNAEALNNAAIQIQYYKDHPSAVNQAILLLNDEISEQNDRGREVIAALNASLQMAADDNKVQLWADHGQLDDYINKLQTLTSDLASNNPLKVALQAITTSAGNLNGNLKTVTSMLSSRPVDEAAVDALQAQIATDLTALNTAISALSSPTSDITSTLSGLTGYVAIVTNDQDKLQAILESAESQATTMLNTQVSSEAASILALNNEFTRIITNLPLGDESTSYLTDYNNTLPAVQAALTQISADLSSPPVNWTTLTADYNALQQALNYVSNARFNLTMAMSGSSPITLSNAASDALAKADALIENVTTTNQSLISFLVPSSPFTRPIAVLPPPILLAPVPLLDGNKLTFPSTIPTSGAFTGATNNNSATPSSFTTYFSSPANAPPLPPDPADVKALNSTINYLNKILAPVLGRLHANGNTKIILLDPVYIRDYIPVRDPASFIDFSVLAGMDNLISLIIQNEQSLTDTANNPPTTALFSFKDAATSPNVTSGGATATGVGAGTGLGGANPSSGAGPVSISLTAVLSSTDFQNYVRGIFEKSGLVAGLTAIGSLATTVKAKSEFGVVTPGVTPTITTDTTIATGLTAEQKTALASGVQELLSATENVPQLKNDLLAILKATGESQKLSDEEIQQLLSLLLFLLQLVSLLVASAAVAAGGGSTNIDTIVQKAFEKPADTTLQSVTTSLSNLGVKGLTPEITPSNPQFISNFIDILNENLTPAEQLGFVAKVTKVFTDRGITLNPELPIGQAVQEVLLKTPSDVAGEIRQQLNKIALAEAEQLRSDILHDSSRRPSITTLIKQLNPEGFSQLPKDQTSSVSILLNNTGPTIPGITPEDRNSLVLSVLKGVITPEQAKNIVEEFLKEGVLQTNPAVGSLLTTALKPTTTPEPTTTTPVSAVKPGTPGELPDLVNLLTTAFKALSKQTNDEKFLQDTVTRFADSVRDQSDFFQKSLSLILDPANTYVKNFSIVTRQPSGHDNMGSVSQIPIAG
ncbi:MAG: hypothetical protein LLF94_00010 [Chlamydiales bacterium]|nr:hypothetical protein [Chlamydiales bacterium]